MSENSPASPAAAHRPSPLVLGLLALAMLVAVGLKIATADRPVARDVMLYTVIGHEMFEGRELYSDLFEHKPPLFLTIYGLANTIAGYGGPAILLLNITFALATLLGIYEAGRLLGKSPWAGLFAAGCWALISNDVNMHAHQPMPECFINACMIWAFALFLKLDSEALHPGRCLAIGALLLIASQVKQPVVFIAAGFAFVHLITRTTAPGQYKRRLLQLLIIAGVGAVSWIAMFAYFHLQGRGQVFYDSLFTYNRHYAGLDHKEGGFIQTLKVIWWNFNNGLLPHRLYPSFMFTLAPLVVAALVAMPLGLIKGDRRAWLLWLAFFIMTFVLVTMPGRGYNHYYLVYLPLFVAGGAGSFALLDQMMSTGGAKRSKIALTLIAMIALAAGTVHQLVSPNTIWERPGYAAHYTTVTRLAAKIDRVLLPDETLYVWDYQPAFYVLPQRRPPAGIFFNTHAMKGPLREELTGRVMRMLEENPPQVIIIDAKEAASLSDATRKRHPVYEWIRDHADQVELPGIEPFALFILRDGPLAKRMAAGQVTW